MTDKPKKRKPTQAELKERFPNGQATVEQIKYAYLGLAEPSIRNCVKVLQDAKFQTSERDVGAIVKVYNHTGEWPTERPKNKSRAKPRDTRPEAHPLPEVKAVDMTATLGNSPEDLRRKELERIAKEIDDQRKTLEAMAGGELETEYKKSLLAFSTMLVRTGAARCDLLIQMPAEAGALLKHCSEVADKVKMITGTKPVVEDAGVATAAAPVEQSNAAIDLLKRIRERNKGANGHANGNGAGHTA